MARTIATLRAMLTLDTSRFGSGLSKSVAMLTNWKSKLLAGVGVGGLGLFIKNSIEAADKLGEMSERTGIATDKLANLQRVAQLAGVDDIADGIQKMNVRLAQAAEGSGEAGDALRGLGLDAKELIKLAPDKAFGRIADAIKKLPSPMMKAKAAHEIFGRSGTRFLTVLNQGSAAIDAQMKSTKALGIALTSLDVAKMDMLADRMDDFKNALKGIGNQISINLVTPLNIALSSMIGMGEKGVDAADAAAGAFHVMGTGVMTVAHAMDSVVIKILKAQQAWNRFTTSTEDAALKAEIIRLEGAGDPGGFAARAMAALQNARNVADEDAKRRKADRDAAKRTQAAPMGAPYSPAPPPTGEENRARRELFHKQRELEAIERRRMARTRQGAAYEAAYGEGAEPGRGITAQERTARDQREQTQTRDLQNSINRLNETLIRIERQKSGGMGN